MARLRGAAWLVGVLAVSTACGGSSGARPPSLTVLAGMPSGASNADGPGPAARFHEPYGVAVDGAGIVYVGDTSNHSIRRITPAGEVTTLAGLPGHAGRADGAGSAARLNQPEGVAVDRAGNVYVADMGNGAIRKISPAGVVSTLAPTTSFAGPCGVAVDEVGNVYVANTYDHTILTIAPSGDVATLAGTAGHSGSTDGTGAAASFYFPEGIAVDAAGNVYVADTGNDAIRKVTPAGVVSTVATFLARGPFGVAVDGAGNLYVGNFSSNTVEKITPTGEASTLAGSGSFGSTDGTGSAASFAFPAGVAVDGTGNVYVADLFNNAIRKITPAGAVTTLAGSLGQFGSTDGTGSVARFNFPSGAAVDAAGNVYVADSYNNTVRVITPSGVVSTLAGTARVFGSDDGTGPAAGFYSPDGVAVDASGNVYVADRYNDSIRKITPAGVVTTLAGWAGHFGSTDGTGPAATFDQPYGIAVDRAGNVYVADSGNSTIRKITPAGAVSTLAGTAGQFGTTDGTGSAARFFLPYGVAVDEDGTVYVADTFNGTIRKITPEGVVGTLAGTPGRFGRADGTGATATFDHPYGIAVDGAGNVYVADTGNDAVRKVTPTGVVTTVTAAGAIAGPSPARLFQPAGIACSPTTGRVFITIQDAVVEVGF